ncbi:MAG: endolytic transglycosylase MltG [Candidatus Marinimicrobia bacterium]|jgi:UPF0755 protein|nr:endolytic transglycosylase MltG [Candidatus Neomarinimicrobiota bacterium]MBT3634106.1 endolytic transglycosylase MltG [Candidatus Neomarinimicrobiota bacterium]MBT3683020.1 endolytic transglycosylase MltG [Candidatus Neomarinimicrobiota bacterium]MBT3759888.1 endolytic transglycosylase MltG [Candidatus Neomarinimicrobiota bacterium]MBT3895659.1 endolytic transglycosylase MltG [Candidatus Neomarinimicrobiota bacterium]
MVLSMDVKCNHLSGYLTIPKGASVNYVGRLLYDQNCLSHFSLFSLAMKLTLNENKLKAGRFSLENVSRMDELIKLLTSSTGEIVKTVIYEGYTIQQIAQVFTSILDIDEERFMYLCRDKDFIKSLNINSPTLEGYLFPDTYQFLTSYMEADLIKIMVANFHQKMKKVLDNTTQSVNMVQSDIVILASIIQGEAMLIDEMEMISSVYHNRLNEEMMLQADPTIQYILPSRKEKLYNKDLTIDSPYNTYMYKGLPPGAINNPGIDALKAAAYPDSTEYLYFVANGDGRHIFSRNVEEHNKAKYRIKRKKRNNQN